MDANQLSRGDIDSGLAYCRWLHNKQLTAWTNEIRKQHGLPLEHPGMMLNDRGKNVFRAVLRQIEADRQTSSVLTCEGQRKAVVQYLCMLKDRPRRPRSTEKRATVNFTQVEKFVSGGKRTVRGLASSPREDRMGDIVEPAGGTWSLPVPLLWAHDHKSPVGWVREATAGRDGVRIVAEFAEGIGRADEIWAMCDAGLLDSFSIGFRAIKAEPLSTGGYRYVTWELLEVSVVAVPAQPDAKIRRSTPGGSIKLSNAGNGAVRITQRASPGAAKLPAGTVRIKTRGGRK